MRTPLAIAAAVFLSGAAAAAQTTASQKNSMSLNGAWNLQINGTITTVNVPADIPLFGGVSIWSRTFTLSLPRAPLVAYLDFGGIVNTAVVKLNGIQLGSLVAFTHTQLDASRALNFSGANTLEVDIDDRIQPSTIPGGPTNLYVPAFGSIAYTFPIPWAPNSGILRDVSLIYSDHAVITNAFAAPNVSPKLAEAAVMVRVQVQGAPSSNVVGLVAIAWNGTAVGSCQTLIAPNGDLACLITVKSPQLWSPDQPNLYDLWVVLADGSGVADVLHDETGFRRFETRGNQLYLNNRLLFLRGITRHDIYAHGSFVADEPTILQDLQELKKMGANYIRCIHYPPDPRVARIADKVGIMLSEEIPAYADFTQDAVIRTAQTMVQAMIERDFNRPSVVFWITGNGNYVYGPYLQQTAATAKAVDSTRPVSFVVDDPTADTAMAMQANLAIVGSSGMDLYLQNGYWWASVIAQMVPGMPVDKPVIITEWSGSEGSNRGPIGALGTTAFPYWTYPGTGVFPEEYQATTMLYLLDGWLPYVNCTSTQPSCVAGLTFFNFQDVDWPGLPYFSPGHLEMLRNGLFYEDRTPKLWPVSTFQFGMSLLPQ
jgi:hypothetical protein